MRTKMFVVASLGALAGLVVTMAVPGCSSDETSAIPSETDASSDAGVDVRQAPKDSAVEDPPETGPAKCPTTTPITAASLPVKWQPPPAIQDVCTQPNIDALKAAFKAAGTGSVKFTDIKTALGATCSACVFSPVNGDGGLTPTWSVFAETATGAYDNRTAICFARLKSETCGRTRSQFEFCLRTGCTTADCVNDADLKTCRTKVQSGACKAITDAYVAACPEETDLLAACNIYEAIALGCSGGADAGIDAAPP